MTTACSAPIALGRRSLLAVVSAHAVEVLNGLGFETSGTVAVLDRQERRGNRAGRPAGGALGNLDKLAPDGVDNTRVAREETVTYLVVPGASFCGARTGARKAEGHASPVALHRRGRRAA